MPHERRWVAGLLLAGLVLRLIPVLWGSTYYDTANHGFHPDEPKLVRVLDDFPESILTQHDYRYPTLLPFTFGALWWVVGEGLGLREGAASQPGEPSYESALLFGRVLTVLVYGLGGMWLTWLFARRLWGARAGLGALLLMNGMGLPLTSACLVQTDVPSTVWIVLTLVLLMQWEKSRAKSTFLLAAAASGAAIATKYTAGIVLLPLLAALLQGLREERINRRDAAHAALFALAVIIATFVLFVPGILIDTQAFVDSLQYEFKSKMVSARFSPANVAEALRMNYPYWMMGLAAIGFLRRPRTISWWLPATLGGLVLHALLSARSYRPDYAVVFFPFVAGLGGLGLSWLSGMLQARLCAPWRRGVILFIVVAVHLHSGRVVAGRYTHETHYRFAGWLEKHVPPGPVGEGPRTTPRRGGANVPEGYEYVSVHSQPEWIVLFDRRNEHALRVLLDPNQVREDLLNQVGPEESARLFSTTPGKRRLMRLKERDFKFYEDVLLGQKRKFHYERVAELRPSDWPLDWQGEGMSLYRRVKRSPDSSPQPSVREKK